MVTPADFAAFQQQLRQEVTDVLQQLRAKVNDAISDRMDMLTQHFRTYQPDQQSPSRIESATSFRETGKAAMKRDSLRSFMSDLHLWMQAW